MIQPLTTYLYERRFYQSNYIIMFHLNWKADFDFLSKLGKVEAQTKLKVDVLKVSAE